MTKKGEKMGRYKWDKTNHVLVPITAGASGSDATQGMIASLESDSTASASAYGVGDYLITANNLYEVIAAIAVGDPLVAYETDPTNANIKLSDNIEIQLKDRYSVDDSVSSTINDTDYVPMSESGGTKKKALWTTVVDKIKTALGIESSGSTYLKKDGTWGTPTNTTYTFATGDGDGQIKVTPSGGSAQNVSVNGLTGTSPSYAVSRTLTNENLNDITIPGFYNAAGGNTCSNTPYDSSASFGLQVIHSAGGAYYYQIIGSSGVYYRRTCSNGTWGSWTQDKYTDTTYSSLSAASSGTAVSLCTTGEKYTWNNKVSKSGDTITGRLFIKPTTFNETALSINNESAKASEVGNSQAVLGNSIASGNTSNSRGILSIFSTGSNYVSLFANTGSDSSIYLPSDKNGATIFTTKGGTITDTLILSKVQDASGTANNSPALIVGGTATQAHLEFDANEIMAKASGTTTENLLLNNDGGQVQIGSGGLLCRGNPISHGDATINTSNGTTSQVGLSMITLGNGTKSGVTGNSVGQVRIYSQQTSYIQLRAQDVTSGRTLWLPASGTELATSASSSYRVKENIRDMTEEEAQKILDVNVVKFDYKEEFRDGQQNNQGGVIAEEVLDIIPEVVTVHPTYDETKAIDPASNPSPTVDYGKFAPYLIKMVQMQQERIEALEQRLSALENN